MYRARLGSGEGVEPFDDSRMRLDEQQSQQSHHHHQQHQHNPHLLAPSYLAPTHAPSERGAKLSSDVRTLFYEIDIAKAHILSSSKYIFLPQKKKKKKKKKRNTKHETKLTFVIAFTLRHQKRGKKPHSSNSLSLLHGNNIDLLFENVSYIYIYIVLSNNYDRTTYSTTGSLGHGNHLL
jgi:hypothetical protein